MQGAEPGHTRPHDPCERPECNEAHSTGGYAALLHCIDTYYNKQLMGECEAVAAATSSLSTPTLVTTPMKPEPKNKQ